jgi:RNA recognition motif-containing protein
MRQAGDVVRADIFEDEKGRSRGMGVVEYRSRADMDRAIKQMSQSNLDGRKIFVKEDTEHHVLPPLTKNVNPMNNNNF